MKKLSLVILGSVISLALVTGVFAQSTDTTAPKAKKVTTKTTTTTTKTETVSKDTTAKPVAKKATAAKKQQFTGVVTAVDGAANTVTVEKKSKKASTSMTFTAGEKVKVADIKKDSKVIVVYTKDGDKATAVSVKEVVAKKAAAKKTETKKTETTTTETK